CSRGRAAEGKPITASPAHAGAVTGVAFHPQGTQMLTSGADGVLKLWSMPPVPGRALAHADGVTSVALSADAKRLITGGADKLVRAWDLTNNQMERQFAGHGAAGTAGPVWGQTPLLGPRRAAPTAGLLHHPTPPPPP